MKKLTHHAISKSKHWFVGAISLTILLIILVLLPTVRPQLVPFLHALHVDTDPENMLEDTEPVRQFHNEMKREFNLYDLVVVGIVNEKHDWGVFNKDSLKDIYELTEYAKDLQWEEGAITKGVIRVDIIAPSTVDNIEQGGLGSVRFDWLMKTPPSTDEEALSIAKKAQRIPFLDGTLISTDRKAIALYIPITSKAESYDVAEKLREKIADFSSDNQFFITGLPIAQDQFGVEMFHQMAVSAPIAMALIFFLMWLFFRNAKLIAAPMVVAVLSVIMTMGLLIVSGNTLHIMSSMIPIFIMPISVLDAVHILSDFFDRYPHIKNREKTIKIVMDDLNAPMLFTSLTTCAGFASLAFTPIPPVRVFGIFISIGVFLAWILTITLVPAYIMLLPESSLSGFGSKSGKGQNGNAPVDKFLGWLGGFTFRRAKWIAAFTPLLLLFAYYGIQKIVINDNPIRWFESNHPIRVAERVMNDRFGGTYMAYLALTADDEDKDGLEIEDFQTLPVEIRQILLEKWEELKLNGMPQEELINFALLRQNQAKTDEEWEKWDESIQILDQTQRSGEAFKNPAVLRYMERFQSFLSESAIVGKSNSLTDIVKTVHRDLFLGSEEAFRIPDSPAAVAQTLITYESSHRPQDLWHFVTPDFKKANIWVQLKSGDNKDMKAMVDLVEIYFNENPPPVSMKHRWFGLTYINVIWQEKMVAGMRNAFLGSFVIVLVMMIFLFRSILWGILSMIPLTAAIGFIYGIIGFIGKDYDMPVAVLSSLSLGLAVDYAIHFLARSRFIRRQHPSWEAAVRDVFNEPARAIFRNVVVIGIGFLPLLAAPLIPYKTVGVFISAILLSAGAVSLLVLPALITVGERFLFKNQ